MTYGASPTAAFHLIGDRGGLEIETSKQPSWRPALWAGFSDLTGLRYDFPLVLLNDDPSGNWVRSLTDITDEALQEISEPGPGDEELRRQALAQEQILRGYLASGKTGQLSALREDAAKQLAGESNGESLATNLERLAGASPCEGDLIDCNRELAPRMIRHAWLISEKHKADRLAYRLQRLRQKLYDILQVDYMTSKDSKKAARLESAMGSADRDTFDFGAMAKLLKTAPTTDPLPEPRKQRIQAAIDVVNAQRFIPLPGSDVATQDIFGYEFSDCTEALEAFRERLPAMAELVKAISIGELEIDNHYDEGRHDSYFGAFEKSCIGPEDLAMFPACLLTLEQVDEAIRASVVDILGMGLPFKIIAQTADILGSDDVGSGRFSLGVQGQRLGMMVTALGSVFVLQAANSSLYRMHDSIAQGVSGNFPALFSIYAGPGDYLDGAAATESRTFPGFAYNPEGGPVRNTRFRLRVNPQADEDWPLHALRHETGHQSPKNTELAFTVVDFMAAHPHFHGYFAPLPENQTGDQLMPLADFLALSRKERADRIPFVRLVDENNRLVEAIVNVRLVNAADRCLDAWRNLQEKGGINNSHAADALEKARAEWEKEKAKLAGGKPAAAEPAKAKTTSTKPAAAAPAKPAETAAEDEPPSDDPWIETIRCTTCNECTQINDRMFAYDAEKRAYIKDPDAGTYRQLVEAAETCQVAIIHPGKPRNLDEEGLDDLMERAEALN